MLGSLNDDDDRIPSRLIVRALCEWLDAHIRGDQGAAESAARETDCLVRTLPVDDPLRPTLDRFLFGGEPRSEEAAVECVLAIMDTG